MPKEIPQPLIEDIAEGRCLPIVGAGFSLNARLPSNLRMPDWKGLTEILAQIANISPDEPGPKVASKFEHKFGRVELIETIRRALHAHRTDPGDSHKAFVLLPFDTIYTTNFDSILEDACTLQHKPFRSLVGQLQLPFHAGMLTTNIIKMHGDLRHEEHLIITQRDYDRYLKTYPIISTHLSAMLITRTPLFIGYSLSDPDFQLIRKVIKSRLGKFERMTYHIQFDVDPVSIEAKLQEHVHIISLSTKSGRSRDAVLADFFTQIQQNLDIKESIELREARPEAFESVTESKFTSTARAADASPLLSSSSNLCFVLMPFEKDLDQVYRRLIKPAGENFGLNVLRADEMFTTGTIMEQVRTSIQNARLCIADLSSQNANVMYEVGLAHSLGKPTVLMTNDIMSVPFDLRANRLIVYNTNSQQEWAGALEILKKAIESVLIIERLYEGRNLIELKHYRSGVAELGMALEAGLRALVKSISDNYQKPLDLHERSISSNLNFLLKEKRISPNNSDDLTRCIHIRNKAVHELREPTEDDARFVLETVTRFISEYFGSLQ